MMIVMPGPRPALLAAVLVTLAAALFYREHRSREGEVQRLTRRLEQLEAGNERARNLLPGGTAQLASRLRRYSDHIARLEQLIPRTEEVPALLESLAVEARRSGLGDLAFLRPGEEEANPFYTSRTYEMSVVGGYHEVARFLTAVASLPRIVTPMELEMISIPDPAVEEGPAVRARFRIETFVRPPTGTGPALGGSNGTPAEVVR
ncbi:MAG: type 4a pilus biogenesis protein PilO [Gammaproteobacteria bacterium]|nr:type 4a pilus biogenesis protein PilO [Gammaproteobacteria bacterium]